MSWLQTRFLLVTIVAAGAMALAWAQRSAEFGYLDLHDSSGRAFSLRSEGEAARTGRSSMQLSGDGVEATVEVPVRAEAGSTIPVTAIIDHEGNVQRGQLSLDVEEAGPFVSGKLRGSLGAWNVDGGLRVRVEPGASADSGRQLAARP